MTHTEILQEIYNDAMVIDNGLQDIKPDTEELIALLASHSETSKGVMAVLITLMSHKIVDPDQDIRNHQAQLKNGFSGRAIDTKEITPFLKSVRFPAMSSSGWLTRSLEQPHPYTLDYPGKIQPNNVKSSFLEIVDKVQEQGESPRDILFVLFRHLIKRRDSTDIALAKPHNLTISAIISILEKHFNYRKYQGSGASRLPTLAVYAAYECMMGQIARYEGKELCMLKSHNSSDTNSGRIGDIDVNNPDGTAFEGVEIKHNIQITQGLISDAYEKFKAYNTDRYYLLTTANMDSADWDAINEEIRRIAQIHGCQVIVDEVYSTLQYYLRLVKDPAEFINHYVELIKIDDAIKFQHKTAWNEIISSS